MKQFNGRGPRDRSRTGTSVRDRDAVNRRPGNGRLDRNPTMSSSQSFNMRLLIGCVLGGFAALVVSLVLVSLFFGALPNILLFGLLMVLFSFGIMLGGAFSADRYKVSFAQALFTAVVGALVIAFCASAFEFIYELRFLQKKTVMPTTQASISMTDYIFCVDDSGSMDTNDPTSLRDSAIDGLLDELDTTNQVGLLRFDDWIKSDETVYAAMLDDTQKKLIREHLHDHSLGGGTNYSWPLREGLNQFKQIDETGRIPVVVLVTDGECAINTNKWIKKYQNAGITICGIYLGESDQIPPVLQDLADGTNGIVINADKDTDLQKAFNDMVTQTGSSSFGVANDPSYRRFLLGPRRGADRVNPLAFIERVLFFALLGLALGFFLYREMDSDTALRHQVVLSGIEGLICGAVLEIGYLIGLGDFSRVALMLMTIVLAQYVSISFDAGRVDRSSRFAGGTGRGRIITKDRPNPGSSRTIRRG